MGDIKTYKCPNCDGAITFDATAQKMKCPYCKTELNCIECKNDEDVYEFKENFEKGVYENEVEDSLHYLGSSRQR